MENIVPFLMIFFFVLRFIFGLKKSKKSSDKNILEEFEDLSRRIEQQMNTPTAQQPVYVEPEAPVYQKPERTKYFEAYEAKSSEITEAPYSNLEEGIIDSVHQSKFAHHNDTESVFNKKPKRKKNVFGKVSAKEAFKYSVIFEKKY